MKIVLIGMKGSGKTTVGKLLAKKLSFPFIELDSQIEKKHSTKKNELLSSREIYKQYGKEYFRLLEQNTLKDLYENNSDNFVFSTGGGTPLDEQNREIL